MELGRVGTEIEIGLARGDRTSASRAIRAYVADPASGLGPGVIVLHEGWGLTDHIREVCERLARAGFTALAPDLLRGESVATPADAETMADTLDVESAAADIDSAVIELFGRNATEGARVGALGFGLGGHLALLAASRNRRIGAVVDFYGLHSRVKPDFAALTASVLAIFAGDDESIAKPSIRTLEADIARSNVRASIQTRPGVRPGYMNDTILDTFDAAAAAEGWDATVAFLRAELA